MYQFFPPRSAKPTPFMCADNLFTNDELKKIVEIGDALETEYALSFDINKNCFDVSDYRKCKVSVLSLNSKTGYIYDKIADFINTENEKHFGFDLYGFVENFQYLRYDNLDDHYEWHVDMSSGISSYRKLTFVLQLSDPSEYEGGELQLMLSKEPLSLPKKLGVVSLFPSYVLHRVTPITKGVRKSLIVWVTGKPFR